MLNYDYIFFDLDGTLTDSAPGILNSVMYALEHYGIRVQDRGELRRLIGPPLIDSFRNFYGFSDEDAWNATMVYREYFADRGLFENDVYPGIPETLRQLKDAGKHLIVATSKPETYSVRIVEHFGLAKYFDFVAGAAMDETRTKKDEVIEYALERCGFPDRGNVLMIGDREHDILGAKKCGMACMGVLYGYGSREELESAGACWLAADASEIANLILK